MAFAKIFVFSIVFQVITIVQACNFKKEAKDVIKLGYHLTNEGHYNFSILNLTFTNIPKSFDCKLENGTKIKLSLNYKVKKKVLSRDFTIDYEKGNDIYTKSFSDLNEENLLKNCQSMVFELSNEFGDKLEFEPFSFPGPGKVENLRFDEDKRDLIWKKKETRESCTSHFNVIRMSYLSENRTTADGDVHQKAIYYLEYCQKNDFKVFPWVKSMDGELLPGIPELAEEYYAPLKETYEFKLVDLRITRNLTLIGPRKHYTLMFQWMHFYSCFEDYNISISFKCLNGNTTVVEKHENATLHSPSYLENPKVFSMNTTIERKVLPPVCQIYDVTVKPANPSNKTGKWYDGMNATFKHVDFNLLNVTVEKSSTDDKIFFASWEDPATDECLEFGKYVVVVKVNKREIGRLNISASNEVNKTMLNLNDIPGFVNVEHCEKFTLSIEPILSEKPEFEVEEFSQEFYKNKDCNGTFLAAYTAIGIILGLILVALIVTAIVFYRRKKANEQEQEGS